MVALAHQALSVLLNSTDILATFDVVSAIVDAHHWRENRAHKFLILPLSLLVYA